MKKPCIQCGAVKNAATEVKFSQDMRALDPWCLIGGTRWSRVLFRLKHPIVYSKRGLCKIYRKIKRKIFSDPPMILTNMEKEEWKKKK